MNFIEHILEPKRLLLVWQGSEGSSRTRHTVAELLRQGDKPVRLRYLTGTQDFDSACEEGFTNFPAFRKVDQTYDLGVEETFMRRLPPRSRGDYGQYLEQFRLRPGIRISDFALLAYTGAKLPGDGFSIISPLEDVVGSCEILLEVAGFRYSSQLSITDIQPGETVMFEPEANNPSDLNSVAILVRGQKIGYVPRQQAPAIRRQSEAVSLSAQVERVNGRTDRPLVYLFTTLGTVAQAASRSNTGE